MTDINLPPRCPLCGGKTKLKEMHRSSRSDGFSCFFRCVDCGTDYPRALSAADVKSAGFSRPLHAAEGDPATGEPKT